MYLNLDSGLYIKKLLIFDLSFDFIDSYNIA